jgi:hypothetical protein
MLEFLRNLREADLKAGVRSSPDPGNPRHPIFAIDRLPALCELLRRKDSRHRGKFGPDERAAHRTRPHRDIWIVANTLGLSHIAARHDVKLASVFTEPDRGRDSDPILAKSLQRDVFLIVNGGRNLARHGTYCKGLRFQWGCSTLFFFNGSSRKDQKGRNCSIPQDVLQA